VQLIDVDSDHGPERYESGVVLHLEQPITWGYPDGVDPWTPEKKVYALGPDGDPVENQDWRSLEARLRQEPARTEFDPTPLGGGGCCALL